MKSAVRAVLEQRHALRDDGGRQILIGVEHDDDVAACALNRQVPLRRSLGSLLQKDVGVPAVELGGPVGGEVVDDDQFHAGIGLGSNGAGERGGG